MIAVIISNAKKCEISLPIFRLCLVAIHFHFYGQKLAHAIPTSQFLQRNNYGYRFIFADFFTYFIRQHIFALAGITNHFKP